MSEPKKVKARLLDAQYIKEAKSVLMVLECDQGRWRSQIHRNALATFGDRTEPEIEAEMEKYVNILKHTYIGQNKFINAVFDTDLNDKIKNKAKIKY
jgi:hypothetical protein